MIGRTEPARSEQEKRMVRRRGLTLLDRDDLPKLAQLAAEQSRADTAA